MRLSWLTLASILSLGQWCSAQPPPQTFFPASVPLAVRSPYLNSWWHSRTDTWPLPASWPTFAIGRETVTGWNGKIRVDGVTYEWLGNDAASGKKNLANVTSFRITPTRSIFFMQAGPLNITVTFLTPIEPSDWVRQSIPLSYVSVEASSLDGKPHSLQVYSDISGEWLSGDLTRWMHWSTLLTGSGVCHRAELQAPTPNGEVDGHATDGVLYYAMAHRSGLTRQIDTDELCRLGFKNVGRLQQNSSTAFNAPLSQPWTVFAISVDLGDIQQTSEPVAWAVGLVRNPSVAYTLPSGDVQKRVPYFLSQYESTDAAVDMFAADFPNALQNAIRLDERILGEALKVSQEYADLVSISTRQVFASLDIALGTGTDGALNSSDVKVFLKDMGLPLTAGRINPVEVIHAAFPSLLYFNASLGGALIAPLMEAQESPKYQLYAAPDLGNAYPVAQGHSDPHSFGIEHSASMLIMAYAHAVTSGDGTLIQRHYGLLKKWADYLVDNTLIPAHQRVPNLEGFNLTNLAVKGIVAVKAMARIGHALRYDDDGDKYDDHASRLAAAWQSLAVSSDKSHVLGTYAAEGSWTLLYNLYFDKMLGLNVTSDWVLQTQTTFYAGLFDSGVAGPFGLPTSSDAGKDGNAAWHLLTAATVTDTGVRDEFIRRRWARASRNVSNAWGGNPSVYDVFSGLSGGGEAGAAQGAMYAILALDLPKRTILVPGGPGPNGQPNKSSYGSPKPSIGAIAGGAVSGMALLVFAALVAFLILRRRNAALSEHSGRIDEFRSSSPEMHENPNPHIATTLPTTPGSTSPHGSDGPLPALYASGMDPSYALPLPSGALGKLAGRTPLRARNASVSESTGRAPSALPTYTAGQWGAERGGGVGDPRYPSRMESMRAELENLRRVVEVMEPPPRYEG